MSSEFPDSIATIAASFAEHEGEYKHTALAGFSVLEREDPETAKLAVDVFKGRAAAAGWFGDHVGSLGGRTPWQCVAAGEADKVRNVLIFVAI